MARLRKVGTLWEHPFGGWHVLSEGIYSREFLLTGRSRGRFLLLKQTFCYLTVLTEQLKVAEGVKDQGSGLLSLFACI